MTTTDPRLMLRPVPARPGARPRPDSFDDHPEVVATRQRIALGAELSEHGHAQSVPRIPRGSEQHGRTHARQELLNFSSYSYLGLAGHPRLQAAAKSAIDTYGTSVAACRVVSGEIPLYAEIEERLARTYGVADAIVTTSGYITNAAVIGFLLDRDDLAVCDALVHNSIVAGTQWAGCRRVNFRHNDPESLDAVLKMSRTSGRRALVVLEGHYSMEGDIPPLPDLIAVARRHECVVMIDEAHSFGVLGTRGGGIREFYGLPPDAVDIWMGTLSKALGSCGGFLAGSHDLIMALKYAAPGLSMFTGGAAPSAIAAALAGLDIVDTEPQRVRRVQSNGRLLWELLRDNGFDTGRAEGTPIVPVVLGGDMRAAMISMKLIDEGVNVHAIMPPAVPAGEERLRFFATSEHTEDQLRSAVAALTKVVRSV